MKEMQIFNYYKNEIRTVMINNEPWWVAKDVCEVLDFANPNETLKRLDVDEVNSTEVVDSMGRRQTTNIINETGLYSLILGSRKPEAKAFKRWITHEILPSIRKNGMYAKDELLDNPDLMIHVLTELKAEREKKRLLENRIEQDKPKVLFAEAVETSRNSILIGELAKLLNQNGIDIGQNRLFTYLRENDFLCKRGESRNLPTQRAMDMDLFEIKKRTILNPDGSNRTTATTKVTGKGQIYFINHFKKAE